MALGHLEVSQRLNRLVANVAEHLLAILTHHHVVAFFLLVYVSALRARSTVLQVDVRVVVKAHMLRNQFLRDTRRQQSSFLLETVRVFFEVLLAFCHYPAGPADPCEAGSALKMSTPGVVFRYWGPALDVGTRLGTVLNEQGSQLLSILSISLINVLQLTPELLSELHIFEFLFFPALQHLNVQVDSVQKAAFKRMCRLLAV